MEHPNSQNPEQATAPADTQLVLSSTSETGVTPFASATEVAVMRQMMETLFSRMEALQQNQAIQLSGVNDRLDAVELDLPLIQEQNALSIRDLETRMESQIEEAAKSAAEGVTAGLQEQVSGKFGSLEAQLEMQRKELAQLRDSRKTVETRLNRVVMDIERLCGTLGPRPVDEVYRPAVEPPAAASPFRSRIAEQIRKAALDAAPDESNPLIADPAQRRPAAEEPAASITAMPVQPHVVRPVPVVAATAPAAMHRASSGSPGSNVPRFVNGTGGGAPAHPQAHSFDVAKVDVGKVDAPASEVAAARVDASKPAEAGALGFDNWKRQFMQEGEPLMPTLHPDPHAKSDSIVCPRCFSDRTRPATRTKLDGLFRLTGFSPHRCRSCAHRFYKRGTAAEPALDDDGNPRNEEALETR